MVDDNTFFKLIGSHLAKIRLGTKLQTNYWNEDPNDAGLTVLLSKQGQVFPLQISKNEYVSRDFILIYSSLVLPNKIWLFEHLKSANYLPEAFKFIFEFAHEYTNRLEIENFVKSTASREKIDNIIRCELRKLSPISGHLENANYNINIKIQGLVLQTNYLVLVNDAFSPV